VLCGATIQLIFREIFLTTTFNYCSVKLNGNLNSFHDYICVVQF